MCFLMATVFVLVNSDLGAEEQVVAALQAIQAGKETYLVYGVYDIIGKVVAPTMDEIKTTILNQIRGTPGVRSTLTMVVVEAGT